MTSDTDKAPRDLREAFASVAEDARPTEACPEPERLWDAVRGALPPVAAREVGLHVVSCPVCAEAWRVARDLESEIGAELAATERALPTRRAIRSSGWAAWSVAGAAAALLVLVLVVPFDWPDSMPTPAGYRAGFDEPIQSLLVPSEPLMRESCVLQWSGLEGARYDLFVAAEDLTVLAQTGGLTRPEYRVPAELLDALPPGARLLWQVEATMTDGTTVSSRTFVSELE